MKIAAIDIGSNSLHMVVARIDAGGHFTLLDRAKEPVRLGKGTLSSRALSAASIQAGLETMATFKELVAQEDARLALTKGEYPQPPLQAQFGKAGLAD